MVKKKKRKQINSDLSKFRTKGEALHYLNVILGCDYDESVDYINDNWDKVR